MIKYGCEEIMYGMGIIVLLGLLIFVALGI